MTCGVSCIIAEIFGVPMVQVSRSDLRDLLLQCCADEAPDVRQSALALLGDLVKVRSQRLKIFPFQLTMLESVAFIWNIISATCLMLIYFLEMGPSILIKSLSLETNRLALCICSPDLQSF